MVSDTRKLEEHCGIKFRKRQDISWGT